MGPTTPQQINTQTYLCVIKTNLMHYLSLVYFVNQPLHVSGIFVAHHQEKTSPSPRDATYNTATNQNSDIALCNKNQLDALVILSLFRQSTSTCFGHICSPSSGENFPLPHVMGPITPPKINTQT
jgi:hypothetical protein